MKHLRLKLLLTLSLTFLSTTLAQGMAGHGTAMMGTESTATLEELKGEDFEVAFMSMMIAHHQGAIKMAEWILERGENDDVRSAAEAIIAAQQAEIEELNTWLADWYDAEPNPMMGMMADDMDIMDTMMAAMEAATSPERGFLEQMSLHHNSAIDMAQLSLLRAEHRELRDLAKDIIVAQAQEIAEYQTWLASQE